ncbi:hypothetical protein [Methanolobus sp. WCC4]|uniref:hypothetical protein n=1 Tax=Methanolobus sp. WCC4 TaxID=3125784 RepID=UPI0030FC14F7
MKNVMFLVLLTMLVPVASAGYSTGGGVSYLTYFSGEAAVDMVYDYDDSRIIYTNEGTDEVWAFYPALPVEDATKELLITNMTGLVDVGLTMDGNIVLGFSNGNVTMVDRFTSELDYYTDSSYFETLYTLDAGVVDIVVDANDNIYASGSNKKIFKLSSPYYTSSQITAGLPALYSSEPSYRLSLYQDGLILAGMFSTSNSDISLIEYNLTSSSVADTLKTYTSTYPDDTAHAIQLTNGDYVYEMAKSFSSSPLSVVEYRNSSTTSITNLLTYSGAGAEPYNDYRNWFLDVVVADDGLVYATCKGGGFLCIDSGGIIEAAPFGSTIYNPYIPPSDSGDDSSSGGSYSSPSDENDDDDNDSSSPSDGPINTIDELVEKITEDLEQISEDVEKVVDGVEESYEAEHVPGIFKMATRGWLRIPIASGIHLGLSDMIGFDIVDWSGAIVVE